VFVYEYLSGGALGAVATAAAADLLAQGAAMRDAIVADLSRIGGVTITCAARGADRPPHGARLHHSEPYPGEDATAYVRRQADAHDVAWVVAPESDGALLALHDAVAPSRWLGCDRRAIEIAGSKRATARHLIAQGIPATQPWEPGSMPAAAAAWVVKPDDGAGATATQVFRSFAAARADWQARPHAAVLEPWVDGEALSLSLLCRTGSAELLSINRQRIEVDAAGRIAYRGVAVNAIDRDGSRGRALRRLAQRVGAALPGLFGFVGIDVVWHPQRGPVVIEVNPRVTCAYVGLSAALGRNLAAELLQAQRAATGACAALA
jgi:predicted ATP-grasp superfamily ATP-dependent carboligase